MQEYPFHAPPVSSYNRFTLYASPTCELSAFRTGGGSGTESLHTLAADAIILVLAGPLNVELYETDVKDFSIFDPTKKLKSCSTASFSAGETFRIVAGEQVVRFLKGGQPALSLCLSSAVQLDLTWEYDPVTLLPARLLADNLQTSRIEYAVKILGQVGTADSVAVLQDLFLHPAHYVRWAVAKSIMAIDEDAGMQILQCAARDRHPEVRAAASRSLSRVHGILHSK
jgi:hypothetical protein